MGRSTWVRRTRGDRGATLVEFGLIGPLLFLLVMGIIDFGMIINNQSSLRQVTRNVARDVTIDTVDHDGVCVNSIADAATFTSESKAIVCEVKKQISSDPTQSRVKVIFPDGNGQKRRDTVVVCAQQPMRSLSGMFSSMVDSKVLTASVAMRIEIEPPGVKADSVAETSYTGTDWTWCT